MSRPMLGDGMYVARSKTQVVSFLEVKMELNLAEKCTLQQTCVSYLITRLFKAFRWKETGRVSGGKRLGV